MDVHDKLDELSAVVEGARSMPMSGSCVVHRGEVLSLLDDVRDLLPEALANAEQVIRERDVILGEAHREAAAVVDESRAERDRLVARHEVLREATLAADDLRAAAEADAARMRRDVEDYTERKLAAFEEVLERTLRTVRRGRVKMQAALDEASLAPADETAQ